MGQDFSSRAKTIFEGMMGGEEGAEEKETGLPVRDGNPTPKEVEEDVQAAIRFFTTVDIHNKASQMEDETTDQLKFLFSMMQEDCGPKKVNRGYGDCDDCMRWLPVVYFFEASRLASLEGNEGEEGEPTPTNGQGEPTVLEQQGEPEVPIDLTAVALGDQNTHIAVSVNTSNTEPNEDKTYSL